jgi:uncharacterized membrane protein YedE/YeeE
VTRALAARLLPLAYGLLFAIGLALSGMAQPEKVIGFLDVLGEWDPSLAFVMLGAVGVYGFTHRRLARRRRPLLAARFSLPTRTRIDGRLIAGATVFGVGWGLSGFCPAPALTALGAGTSPAWWFAPAMVAGMLVHDRVWRRSGPGGDA